MEASATLAPPAALASHATANPICEGLLHAPLVHLRRLSPAAQATRAASQGALFHRRERRILLEAPYPIRSSPACSWVCRRASRASDRMHGPCSDGQTRRYLARGQE